MSNEQKSRQQRQGPHGIRQTVGESAANRQAETGAPDSPANSGTPRARASALAVRRSCDGAGNDAYNGATQKAGRSRSVTKALIFLLAALMSLISCAASNKPCVGPAPGVCQERPRETRECPAGMIEICDNFGCGCGTRGDVERVLRGY